jgi:hypothetical protein
LAKFVSFTKSLPLMIIGLVLELSIVLLLMMHACQDINFASLGFLKRYRKRLTTCMYHITRVGILLGVQPSSSSLWKITTLLPLCFYSPLSKFQQCSHPSDRWHPSYTHSCHYLGICLSFHTHVPLIPVDTHHTKVRLLTFLLYRLVPLFGHLSKLPYVRSLLYILMFILVDTHHTKVHSLSSSFLQSYQTT